MGLFNRKPSAPLAPPVMYDDASAYQVGWITHHQQAIAQVAKASGWSVGEQPSAPIGAALKPAKDPKGQDGYAVVVGGQTIGYMPTSSLYYIKPKITGRSTPAVVVLGKAPMGMGIGARVCV